MIHER